MNLEDFIRKFAEQFDETDLSEFNKDTDFKGLDEWSSLVALSVIALVKTQYGKTITGREIRSCRTIKDLYNLIESK